MNHDRIEPALQADRIMKPKYLILLMVNILIAMSVIPANGQTKLLPWNPALRKGYWSARWITCPGVPARSYGVFHFRKTFELTSVPKRMIVHVTADNRYELFVNGTSIGRGPARGDLYNWNVETYDIAPYLREGKNAIAALVWNMAEYAPMAQISARTGFLFQADSSADNFLNTNTSWKVLHDTAYAPCALNTEEVLHAYFVTGPGDDVHAAEYPWGWQETNYNDSIWTHAVDVPAAAVTFGYGSDNVWTLVPSMIPQMEYKPQRLRVIRRSSHLSVADTFIDGNEPFTIPPHTDESIVLDQTFETVAYPVLTVSGGKGSMIKMTYAEAAFDSNGRKGNRNNIKGKVIEGLYDLFYPDGGADRTFSPLWIRTYRYIELDIKTSDSPLTIDDFYGIYTGYPFKRLATFSSSDPSLEKIWKVGWRTARLCAGETYFDCPYYEELQYEGDTRIQALISLYNTNDDRLVKKAIHDFYESRAPNGLTQGRFPSRRLQIIPPYSLFWISMLHDFLMLRPDPAYVQKYLPAVVPILEWYERHVDPSYDMLGPMTWWNFVDWDTAFPGGVPAGADNGHSSIITEQFIYTLHQAAFMFRYFGDKTRARHYDLLAAKLSKGVFEHCFDKARMEMADAPQKKEFSQHASVFAILAGVIPQNMERKVMERVLTDTTLSQATYYFRFYVTKAMVKAGLGNDYYSQLGPWRNMLRLGLTTFAEQPEPTRSDCHAWSASPVYDFLATICGIEPAAPGFGRVAIVPHLGPLEEVNASMPHPDGEIKVHLRKIGNSGLDATVQLPPRLSGYFVWNGRKVNLHQGLQRLSFK